MTAGPAATSHPRPTDADTSNGAAGGVGADGGAPGQTGAAVDDPAAPARRMDGAGAEVAANAAHPRKASDTNHLLREAEVVFANGGMQFGGDTTLLGDGVGRDKITHQYFAQAPDTVEAYRIGQERLLLARSAFATEPGYPVLLRQCGRRRLVILQAPSGSGRSATALRLLVDNRHREVYGYRPDVTFDRIAGTLAAGTGYLIEDIPAERARALTGLTLNDLETKLGSAGSTLIVTASPGVTFVDPQVQRFVVPLGRPAPHREVLATHLRHRLGDPAAAMLLSRPDVLALFAEQVPPDTPRGRAAEFAGYLEALHRRGRLDLDVLRTRMMSSVSSEVSGWFAGLPDLATRCLAIAIALLDGVPYQTVVSTADSLERRLGGRPRDGAGVPAPPDPFATSQSNRLQQVRAHLLAGTVPTRVGTVPAEIVRYLDPAYPRTVLSLVWREFDNVRDGLLGWLGDLGNHPMDAVRVRAATAVGLLSASAFDHVQKAVILPWARSNSDRRREMAAYALKTPGRSPILRRQVLTLVDGWIRSTSWQLHAAAARVYGSALGAVDAGHALPELDRLAATEDADVAFAIGYSLAELIDADRSLAYQVLDRTLGWMRDPRRARNAAGELAFLTIAADLVAPHPAADPTAPRSDPDRGGGPDWPLLLSLSSTDHRLRNAVATAWHFTLNGALFHRDARAVASRWAELAESDPRARQALAALFATASAGSDRTRRIVRDMASGWTSRSGPVRAPQAAHAVLTSLP